MLESDQNNISEQRLSSMAPSLLNRLLPATLIWVIASYLVHELCSLDVWWHLVIGEDILQQLRIPETNSYSAGALNQPYHDSHWLFQVALALFHRLAGLNGPILFMALIWGLILLVLYREIRTLTSTAPATLLVFLVAGACAERFLPRPEIITFLMIVLFYSRLRQGKYVSIGQILSLTTLQVIWVNSHGLFVIGPFMVGCYWLLHAIHRLQGHAHQFKQLSILLLLITAALFASPYGSGALEYSYLLFREVGQQAPDHMKAVNELSPTFGEVAMKASAFWFFICLLGLTTLSLLLNIRHISFTRLLIVLALGLAAITGRRNIVLFALVAAPFISENLAPYLRTLSPSPWLHKTGKTILAAAMLAWSSYPLSGAYYLHMELPARSGFGVTPDFFPHGIVEFINRHDIKGQVYNTNRLGGFYLYHFFPERIPFIDGRWEIYGEPFFRQRALAQQDYGRWKKWVAAYGISNVLLHHTAAESRMLAPALYSDPDWLLVYYDFAASLFVRNDALGSAQPIRISTTAQALPGEVRLDSRLMLNVFYRNLGLKSPLLDNLERALQLGHHTQDILLEMAQINMELGHYAEAERHYKRLIVLDDEQITALSDLAFIHYQKRGFQQALNYSERALEIEADNPDIIFNHALVLAAAGQRQQAIDLLNDMLITRPDYQKARQLLKEIQP